MDVEHFLFLQAPLSSGDASLVYTGTLHSHLPGPAPAILRPSSQFPDLYPFQLTSRSNSVATVS